MSEQERRASIEEQKAAIMERIHRAPPETVLAATDIVHGWQYTIHYYTADGEHELHPPQVTAELPMHTGEEVLRLTVDWEEQMPLPLNAHPVPPNIPTNLFNAVQAIAVFTRATVLREKP